MTILTGSRSEVLRAPAVQRGTRRWLWLKVLAWLACLAYFLTSLVVIVNAFAWLPSFPSAWYRMQNILYWPVKPYHSFVSNLLDQSSYQAYVLVAWGPFIMLAVVVAFLLLRYPRPARKQIAK